MNIEGSFQHILTDLFAFIATAIAGGVILTTGFNRADGSPSLVVAAMMLRAAYGLLRDSGRVLLEAAPEGMSVAEIGRAVAATRTSPTSTTSTSGRSAPASRPSRRTCSSTPATTATRSAANWRRCSRALRYRPHDAPGRPRSERTCWRSRVARRNRTDASASEIRARGRKLASRART